MQESEDAAELETPMEALTSSDYLLQLAVCVSVCASAASAASVWAFAICYLLLERAGLPWILMCSSGHREALLQRHEGLQVARRLGTLMASICHTLLCGAFVAPL